MWKLVVLLAYCCTFAAALVQPEDVFAWKQLTFQWPSPQAEQEAIKAGQYIPENNLPLGLGRWRNKLFLTVPRWKAGVASSLNYVTLDEKTKEPALKPYPDWKANTLPKAGEKLENNHIISTFRVQVDECDRLWVMDTGLADILGAPSQYSKPALVVFDLNTDKLVRRYEFKATDLKESSFFANVIVDVNKDKCDEAYAYIPDLGGYGIVVYSWKSNDSWRIKHNFFHFDPLNGEFLVGGVEFQWTDGVFGIALGPRRQDGYRTVYFHALASTHQFSVNSHVLQNQTLATDPSSYHLYKIEGNKGEKTQTSTSDLDQKTEVLFLTQLNRDAVACWNTKKPLNPENVAIFTQDPERLVFTNDLKVDAERNLWILSDRMPEFIYKKLDPNRINYRILKIGVDQAIANTPCAN